MRNRIIALASAFPVLIHQSNVEPFRAPNDHSYDLDAFMSDLTESRAGQTRPVAFDPVKETNNIALCRAEAHKRGIITDTDAKGLIRSHFRRREMPGALVHGKVATA